MNDLIEALQIFAKYGNPSNPTICYHDIMYVMIDPKDVSVSDIKKLSSLSFNIDEEGGDVFKSYRFGS